MSDDDTFFWWLIEKIAQILLLGLFFVAMVTFLVMLFFLITFLIWLLTGSVYFLPEHLKSLLDL